MTAAAVAGGTFYALGWLPSAEVGTGLWWLQKAPLLLASAVVLVGIVAAVSGFERRALLAPRTNWEGGAGSMVAAAAVLSVGVKLWASPDVLLVAGGMLLVVTLWFTKLRASGTVAAVQPLERVGLS